MTAKTVAISIFALLLRSASGGVLPLNKDISWTFPIREGLTDASHSGGLCVFRQLDQVRSSVGENRAVTPPYNLR